MPYAPKLLPPLSDGSSIGDWVEPQLRVAYDKGRMPTDTLMLEGPRS